MWNAIDPNFFHYLLKEVTNPMDFFEYTKAHAKIATSNELQSFFSPVFAIFSPRCCHLFSTFTFHDSSDNATLTWFSRAIFIAFIATRYFESSFLWAHLTSQWTIRVNWLKCQRSAHLPIYGSRPFVCVCVLICSHWCACFCLLYLYPSLFLRLIITIIFAVDFRWWAF